jgi:hypothetical protein
VIPLSRAVHRTARGSLRGKLVIAPDWDSGEVNDAIADDFGTAPWVRGVRLRFRGSGL